MAVRVAHPEWLLFGCGDIYRGAARGTQGQGRGRLADLYSPSPHIPRPARGSYKLHSGIAEVCTFVISLLIIMPLINHNTSPHHYFGLPIHQQIAV